jgi:transketolase
MQKLIEEIIKVSHKSREGHIGSSLSILDILYVLYKHFITYSEDRNTTNRFILSKGHASLGYYAVLSEFGLLDEPIQNFCEFNSLVGGHPSDKLKAVEASTGSLGHGLPIAVGIAMGYKIKKNTNRVFTIVGDGEMNEGSMWESLLLAANHNLNNLTCILDFNRSNDRALKLDNITQKVKSFNWNVIEIDGHNHEQIFEALNNTHTHQPTFIIASTIKGKGIPLMENNPEWHHKSPNDEQLTAILNSIIK